MKTITEEYRALQQALHKNPHYGVASLTFAPLVADLMRSTDSATISDYGAGKKNLLVGLGKAGIVPAQYYPYDPAFPEYGPPRSADLVCCIDVLEHIEPGLVDNVIAELASITTRLGFFTVHMGPAQKVLEDGRNAHLIQEPTSWWLEKLIRRFEISQLQTHQLMGHGFWVVVQPRAA